MKKFMFFFLTTLLFSATVLATPATEPSKDNTSIDTPFSAKKVVAIFLEAPITYVNNEKVRILVPEKANSLFPKTTFSLIPYDASMMALRTYKEDNRMIVNQYYSHPVNRSDIQKIAKELKADYALFIMISNDAPRVSAGIFSISFKTTVTCDVRLLNVETGNYVQSKQIVKDGSSTAVYLGVPSFDNAYNEALSKTLDELTIDTSKL